MLANPNIALLAAALGLLLIYVEFCRPGRVIPGVAGGVLLLVGIASIARANQPVNLQWMFIVTAILASIGIFLLRIAFRARRNKMNVKRQ